MENYLIICYQLQCCIVLFVRMLQYQLEYIFSIMMSMVFHHYKILKERLNLKNMLFSKDYEEYNLNQNSNILQKELENGKTYSDILRKTIKDSFNQMLPSSYKYSNTIESKRE